MNIIKRTCANCAAHNSTPADDEPTCWNLVSITERPGTPQALTREPRPDDHCDSHKTADEDAADDRAIAKFWGRIGISSEDRPQHWRVRRS